MHTGGIFGLKRGTEPKKKIGGSKNQGEKEPAEWTKERKQRAKPSFGLVPEFKQNSNKTQRKNPENREGRTGQEPGKKTEAGREERKQKQGRKNPEKQRKTRVKTEAEPEQKQSKEPEKAWVQPTPGSRTLTIIVFVQSRGIRKHRPKAFFPNTEQIKKGKETELRRKEKRRGNHIVPTEKRTTQKTVEPHRETKKQPPRHRLRCRPSLHR